MDREVSMSCGSGCYLICQRCNKNVVRLTAVEDGPLMCDVCREGGPSIAEIVCRVFVEFLLLATMIVVGGYLVYYFKHS